MRVRNRIKKWFAVDRHLLSGGRSETHRYKFPVFSEPLSKSGGGSSKIWPAFSAATRRRFHSRHAALASSRPSARPAGTPGSQVFTALTATVIGGDDHRYCLHSDGTEYSAENCCGNDVNCEQGRYLVPLRLHLWGFIRHGGPASGDVETAGGSYEGAEAPKVPSDASERNRQSPGLIPIRDHRRARVCWRSYSSAFSQSRFRLATASALAHLQEATLTPGGHTSLDSGEGVEAD